jgi:hypothetical protein
MTKRLRYVLCGAQVDLEKVRVLMGQDRILRGRWCDRNGHWHNEWDVRRSPMKTLWYIRVNGKLIDTALGQRRAIRRAALFIKEKRQ